MEAPRLCVVGRPDASAAACRLSWSALPPAGIQKGIKNKKKQRQRKCFEVDINNRNMSYKQEKWTAGDKR